MRLIDADVLIYAIEKRMDDITDESFAEGMSEAIVEIKSRSIIEERKTGRWIPRCDRAKQEVFICSECGRFAYSPWTGSRKTPKKNWCKYRFCPNCGADMRGDHHE